MPEVPHAGEDHGHAVLVGRGDHFLVLDRAARLDDRPGTRMTAIFAESTRLICPAPVSRIWSREVNTMAAFRLAERMGVGEVELDVQPTAYGIEQS